MKDFENKFEKLVNRLEIDDKPSASHKDSTRFKMLAEFNKTGSARGGLHKTWRTAMNSKIAKFATAAIIIAAILIGIANLTGKNETNPEIVENPQPKQIEQLENDSKAATQRMFDLELKLADALYAAGNTEELINLLDTGHMQAKIAAANYLADLNCEDALGKLQELADNWQGEDDNPFTIAAEKIKQEVQTKSSTSQKNVTPETDKTAITITSEDEKDNPPQGFEGVKNVYIESIEIFNNGSEAIEKYWFRLPNHFREESANQIVIDNGKKRLTLNKETMEAQFSPSHIPEKPLTKHNMLNGIIEMFREKQDDDIKLEKINEDDNGKTLVYSIKSGDDPIDGIAWVETATMLPLEIEVDLNAADEQPDAMDPKSLEQVGIEMFFDYEPIDDRVFSMQIPADFKELADKTPGTFSGYVIDELGNPMAGARVHVKARDLKVFKITETGKITDNQLFGLVDDDGYFELKLPVLTKALWSPVVIWATLPDEPDFIAWTMFQSRRDAKEKPMGGQIPGSVGEIIVSQQYGDDVEDKTSYTAWCAGASDITLLMEPAGKFVGTITNGDGQPIENAAIDIEPEPADKYGNDFHIFDAMMRSATLSNKDGYYEVGYLPKMWDKCHFRIRVSAEGYVGTSRQIQIKNQLNIEQADFTLHESLVTVRGTLVDNYGTILPERQIMARVGKTDFYNTCTTKTDQKGKFELKGCPYTEGLQIKAVLSRQAVLSHGNKKYTLLEFYPDVIATVGCVEGQLEYEIELIATLPELVIDVEVVDSAGLPIPDFPVELRASNSIPPTWQSERDLTKRTDEQGLLTLKNVPDVKGLKLVFSGGSGTWGDFKLKGEEKERIKQIRKDYSKYYWAEIPIETTPGKKHYAIRAVIITSEEYLHEFNNRTH